MNSAVSKAALSKAVWASVPLLAPQVRLLPAGATITDVVKLFAVPARFWREGQVTVGGTVSSLDKWHRVRAKAGKLVQLSLAPAGGGDRTKNILAVVASVLLVVATAGIAAGALGPAGLGLSAGLAAGSVGANALAAIV